MPRAKNPRRKVLELTRDIKRTVEALRRVWTVESTVYSSYTENVPTPTGNGVTERLFGFTRPREAHEYPEASLIYWNSLYREAQGLEHMAQELKALAGREYVALEKRELTTIINANIEEAK